MLVTGNGGGEVRIEIDASQFVEALSIFRSGVFTRAVDQALEVVGYAIWRDSLLFVPVLTGALRDSAHLEFTRLPTRRSVSLVYGDARIVYAWIQHEKEFWHPSLGYYGAAKYLTRPLIENADYYQALFTAELRHRTRWGR